MVTILSLRKRLFELWVKNPYTTPKKACEELKEPWPQRRKYVKKLLSEFRSYHNLASPQQAHLHRRVFVWERVDGDRSVALAHGWVRVMNKNNMLVFRHEFGSAHWYQSGKLMLYLRGEVLLARVKELFCKAFSWLSGKELSGYLDVTLREELRHWTFDVGSPMPRFDIRSFERSHGMRIFTDGSHPTCLEIEESVPFWISQVNESISDFGKLHEQFGENLREHLKLIKLWQKEAKGVRVRSKVCGIKEQPTQRSLFDWII